MSHLHVIVYVETESSTLPSFIVTTSTWTNDANSILLNFPAGSYTTLNITNPDNGLHNNVCVNVAGTLSTQPHVAITKATFDEAIADKCVKSFRHQSFAGKKKYLLDSNSAGFLDADKQGCAWYIRVSLDTLQVTNDTALVKYKGRELPL